MSATGRWQEHEPDRLGTAAVHCRLCGRLLPRRVWSAAVDGKPAAFCDPDCEDLYRTYWLPRYGAAERLE